MDLDTFVNFCYNNKWFSLRLDNNNYYYFCGFTDNYTIGY